MSYSRINFEDGVTKLNAANLNTIDETLYNHDIGFGPTAATLIVAASDSLHNQRADYICSGVNDDVTIQQAIDALPAGGGKIYLSEGTFDIGAALVAVSGLDLIGCGISTLLSSSANTKIVNINGVNNIIIGGMKLDGNQSGLVSNCGLIEILNSSHITARDIIGVDSKTDGIYIGNGATLSDHVLLENIYISGAARWGLAITAASEVAVRMADITACTLGGLDIEPNTITDIIRNICLNQINTHNHAGASGFNILLKTGSAVQRGITLNDIWSHNNGNAGGIIYNGIGCKISNSHLYSNGSYGLRFPRNEIDIKIIGCDIHDNVSTGISMLMSSETIDSCNILLDGNNIHDQSGAAHGIVLAEANKNIKHLEMVNNEIYNETYYGAAFTGVFPGLIFRNNRFFNNAWGWSNYIGQAAYLQYSDLFMDVLAVSATHIRSNEDLSAGMPITFTIDAQPDIPRTLSGHFNSHANITEYNIEIIGVDAKGNTVTETKDETDLWDWETNNAFAVITSIKMTSRTGTGVGDTMDIGITDVLGISNALYATSDIFKIKKNNANAAVVSGDINITYDTYDMHTIGLVATDDFTVWYRYNLNIIS